MNKYDVIIVGGGPAGLTASIYAVRANMKTLVLDKLAPGGQIINTNEIANYTGFGTINGAELAIKMFEHSQEVGAEFDYKTVTAIVDEGDVKKVVCLEDDTVYEASAVIIATGTRPRRLHIPGEESFTGAGISWCAICDGAQYRGKDVVVIGGGNSAVEESIYLAGIVNRLTIVTMFDLTADPIACDKLRAMAGPTIRFLGGGLSDEEVRGYYLRAKAFLFPGEEDFGITPVEAQSAGTPVLAFGRGGACETVLDGKTGLLFDEQTPESLEACIQKFETEGVAYPPQQIREHSRSFSEQRFEDELRDYCTRRYADWQRELEACSHHETAKEAEE